MEEALNSSEINYIPFSVNKPNVMENLQSMSKKQSFIPFGFSIEDNLVKCSKIFVPCVVFDGKVHFSAEYTAEKVENSYSGQRVPDLKHYNLKREGDFTFSEAPFFVSKNISAAELNACGVFDFTKLTSSENNSPAFEESEIETFAAETEENKNLLNERIKEIVSLLLKKELKDFTKAEEKALSVKTESESYKIVYLPFWCVEFTWNEKTFRVIVNGQSGNVSGAFPSDKKRYWSLFAEVGVPVAAVAGLLFYLLTKIIVMAVFMGLFAGSLAAVIVCSNKTKKAKLTNGNADYLICFQNSKIEYSNSEDKFLYSTPVARVPDQSQMNGKSN
ncbi:MAG: hypothetical protein MJ162_06155 [Treponema sp.]|nr:hypothetical protein [Treponema sp.]